MSSLGSKKLISQARVSQVSTYGGASLPKGTYNYIISHNISVDCKNKFIPTKLSIKSRVPLKTITSRTLQNKLLTDYSVSLYYYDNLNRSQFAT